MLSRTVFMTVCFFGCLQAAFADETPENADRANLVVFCAMGDVPYAEAEDELLPRQIAALPDDAEFLVHVGDIKNGATPCDQAVYEKVAGMLHASAIPTFVIPGDNEWNDCDDPDAAWRLWEQSFTRFEQHWRHSLPVFRQLNREENFSFMRNEVMFIGLNLVGGRVHDPQEWKLRHADDIEWTQRNFSQFGDESQAVVIFGHAQPRADHDDYFAALVEEATAFDKPILYLHGDGHVWIQDRPFEATNIMRVQVDQGGIAPPLKITVTADPQEPFVFDRRK